MERMVWLKFLVTGTCVSCTIIQGWIEPEEASAAHFWKSRDRWGVPRYFWEDSGVTTWFTPWKVGARGCGLWAECEGPTPGSGIDTKSSLDTHTLILFLPQAGMMEKTWVRFCYENTFISRDITYDFYLMEESISQILIKQSHMCVTVMSPRKEKYRDLCLVIKRDLTWGVRIIRKVFPGNVMRGGGGKLQRSLKYAFLSQINYKLWEEEEDSHALSLICIKMLNFYLLLAVPGLRYARGSCRI